MDYILTVEEVDKLERNELDCAQTAEVIEKLVSFFRTQMTAKASGAPAMHWVDSR
jgi:hypothetical protein